MKQFFYVFFLIVSVFLMMVACVVVGATLSGAISEIPGAVATLCIMSAGLFIFASADRLRMAIGEPVLKQILLNLAATKTVKPTQPSPTP